MKNYILNKRYYTIVLVLGVTAWVLLCVGTRKFINSASTDTVYASQPGEQLEAITAIPTVSTTNVIQQAVGTATPSPSQTVDVSKTSAERGTEKEPNELTVKRQICDVFKYDCDRAIQVALHESHFNPNAKNPGSTATGVFQIVIGTWRLYHCEGERTNSLDNIKCAKKIYDRNHGKFNTAGGWEASFHLHHQD